MTIILAQLKNITNMKPLNQQETTQLLVLLRKLWKEDGEHVFKWTTPEERAEAERLSADRYIASIAKSLFALITKKIYEQG